MKSFLRIVCVGALVVSGAAACSNKSDDSKDKKATTTVASKTNMESAPAVATRFDRTAVLDNGLRITASSPVVTSAKDGSSKVSKGEARIYTFTVGMNNDSTGTILPEDITFGLDLDGRRVKVSDPSKDAVTLGVLKKGDGVAFPVSFESKDDADDIVLLVNVPGVDHPVTFRN